MEMLGRAGSYLDSSITKHIQFPEFLNASKDNASLRPLNVYLSGVETCNIYKVCSIVTEVAFGFLNA
jgi:hypothetical protein